MKKTSRAQDDSTQTATEEGELLEQLTERVERAVETIRKLRSERDQLRARVDESEKALASQGASVEELASVQEEIARLREERDQVRTRISSLLERLATLEDS